MENYNKIKKCFKKNSNEVESYTGKYVEYYKRKAASLSIKEHLLSVVRGPFWKVA